MYQFNFNCVSSRRVQGVYVGMTTMSFLGYCICSVRKNPDLSWKELGKIVLKSLLKSAIWPLSLPYD